MGVGLAEPGFHSRAYVEWEEYPRRCIIAAQRAGYFAPAPIWDDLTTFDAKPLAGAIDTLLAGYPCQPFSAAGQRKGEDDPRHLFPHVARVAEELGPDLEFIILENVPGHVTLGLETVLRTLWDMGFTPAVGLFSASETGAPHERLRMFIVAYRSSERRQQDAGSAHGNEAAHERRAPQYNHQPASVSATLADPQDHSGGLHARSRAEGRRTPDIAGASGSLADTSLGRRAGSGEGQDQQPRGAEIERAGGIVDHPAGPRCQPARIGSKADSQGGERVSGEGCDDVADASGARAKVGRSEQNTGQQRVADQSFHHCGPLHPPGPSDADAWALVMGSDPSLAPSFARRDAKGAAQYLASVFTAQQAASIEQRAAGMEIADLLRAVEREAPEMVDRAQALTRFRDVADGLAERTRALRLLGNGVHPLAAGYAIRTLLAAHGIRPVDLGAAGRGGPARSAGVILNG